MAFDFPSGVYFYYSVNEQAFFPLENVINLLISVNDIVLGIKKKKVLQSIYENKELYFASCPG